MNRRSAIILAIAILLIASTCYVISFGFVAIIVSLWWLCDEDWFLLWMVLWAVLSLTVIEEAIRRKKWRIL